MIKAEFSTTAMSRPKIVNRAYGSFCKRITEVDWENSTLYLNVDPLPADVDPMTVVEVANKYFGNVVYRIPKKANFTAAVQWCWSQVQGPHVFHLEDDWVLRRKVSFEDLVKAMEHGYKGAKLVQVFLRAYRGIDRKKVCLSPSLLDGDFVRAVSKIFDTSLNPEIQLRGKIISGLSTNFSKDISIHDIGRSWMKNSGYQRPSRKARFNKWIEAKKK